MDLVRTRLELGTTFLGLCLASDWLRDLLEAGCSGLDLGLGLASGLAGLSLGERLSFVRGRLGSKLGSVRISSDLGSVLVICLEA